MKYEFTLKGKQPSLNEYINLCRHNKHTGARFKREVQEIISWQIPPKLKEKQLTGVVITFRWYEQNRRRDEDNVKSAKKYILDSLVDVGTLQGDGHKHIIRQVDSDIMIDKNNPRVEIVIEEIEE